MATRYIQKQSSDPAAVGDAAGLISKSSKVSYNPDGTARELLDTVGDFTVTGDISFTGAVTGGAGGALITTADTPTLSASQSGLTVIATKATATQVFTLPAASAGAGLKFTFVCGDAGGEINIDPGTGFNIIGKTHGAENGTGISVTNGADIKNTAASNVLGDFVTLVSDGVDTWYMTAVAGVWAAA